jgi:hypothetical protein
VCCTLRNIELFMACVWHLSELVDKRVPRILFRTDSRTDKCGDGETPRRREAKLLSEANRHHKHSIWIHYPGELTLASRVGEEVNNYRTGVNPYKRSDPKNDKIWPFSGIGDAL